MDCGAATEKNLKWLREQGYRYLVVSRERKRQFDGAAAACRAASRVNEVQVQQVVSEDATEVRLYCYSQALRARSRHAEPKPRRASKSGCRNCMRDFAPAHPDRGDLETHRTAESSSSGAGQHYHIEVIADKSGEQATAIKWEQRPVAGSADPSGGVLSAHNQTDWSPETMWHVHHADRSGGGLSFPQIGVGVTTDLSPEGAPLQASVHHRPGLSVGAGDSPAR